MPKLKFLYFSILELLTVVLIILLLISLTFPIFISLKKNAKSSICKNQLRQIGVLFTSYISDNDGYLPNADKTDRYQLPKGFTNDLDLYANWNGHLLPYLEPNIKSYYKTCAVSIKTGKVMTHNGGGSWFETNSVSESVKVNSRGGPEGGGWDIANNTLHKGGYNELKVFICPETHQNTYDVGVSDSFNGLQIPRISHLSFTYIGFPGLPSTYFANEVFFGADLPIKPPSKSYRIDQINAASKKAFLVEGGLAYAKGSNGEPEYGYFVQFYGDLGTKRINKTDTAGHRMNYVHDTIDRFWLMSSPGLPSTYGLEAYHHELAVQFNVAFEGKAYMIEEGSAGYCIYSLIDPWLTNTESVFDSFLKSKNRPATPPNTYVLYDEPEFHYLTGKMNVLFGDGAVETKGHDWLSINRKFISTQTNE